MSPTHTRTVTDAEKRVTLIALITVFLLSALDMTILSTAMPRIIAELNGIELYAWVTTAYMLTSTVLVPMFGKLGDTHGRKRILVLGIVIFLFGSALCGISGEFGTLPLLGDGMHQLIIFRAVKGVGGAALFTSAIGIIADLFPPLQRARFMGLFGAIFGVASIIGPALGGLLTDYATVTLWGHEVAGWRWVFYANLPLGCLALAMVVRRMPDLRQGSGGRIDYAGAMLIVLVFVPFLLALTWGGNRYAWTSPVLLTMFAGSLTALLLLLKVEHRNPDAVIPLDLFTNRVFAITNLASFVISMAFLGVVMFMPLYMQVVIGINATYSGFSMFPLMGGLIVGSIVSGRLVSRTGAYKHYMVGGCVILIAGILLLANVDVDTSAGNLAWRMAVVGLGLGPFQSLVNIVVQNAFPPTRIGVATSSTQFFRQIGNTVGVAVFGTLLTLNLSSALEDRMGDLPGYSGSPMNLSQAQSSAMNHDALRARIEAQAVAQLDALAQSLPVGSDAEQTLAPLRASLQTRVDVATEAVETGIRGAFADAITGMFGTSLWMLLPGLLFTLMIPVLPLASRDADAARPAGDRQA